MALKKNVRSVDDVLEAIINEPSVQQKNDEQEKDRNKETYSGKDNPVYVPHGRPGPVPKPVDVNSNVPVKRSYYLDPLILEALDRRAMSDRSITLSGHVSLALKEYLLPEITQIQREKNRRR